MIEAGIEEVPITLFQKDFKKLSCLMSSACLKLAYEMIAVGKKPEVARIYGLLVGGTQARLMVAQPVLTLVDGVHQIHINISGDPDWTIDLLSEMPSPEATSTNGPPSCEFFETTLPATREMPQFSARTLRKI